jgi:hypothetical protein
VLAQIGELNREASASVRAALATLHGEALEYLCTAAPWNVGHRDHSRWLELDSQARVR